MNNPPPKKEVRIEKFNSESKYLPFTTERLQTDPIPIDVTKPKHKQILSLHRLSTHSLKMESG